MIKKVIIENFKAIRQAKIKLTDLSVFVGNNGSGKSSIIEALQTLQSVLLEGISVGFTKRWYGLEKIQNLASDGKPIRIKLQCKINPSKNNYTYEVAFNTSANQDLYFVSTEKLQYGTDTIFDESNTQNSSLMLNKHTESHSQAFRDYIVSWQFLSLEPGQMYFPTPRNQGSEQIQLSSTGNNIADYLSRLMDSPQVIDLIIDKMRYVLPDLADFTASHDQVRKEVFLLMSENHHKNKLPSWLFSSGTLRILAMLAVMNSPKVPPVIFIEEIENGLDPRTLNLLVEEIRGLLGESQFIATTHSPYFLDLIDLSHIIVAERHQGNTTYFRPNDEDKLLAWKDKFSDGRLYLMDKLKKI